VRDPQAFEAIAGQVRQAVENGQQQASAAA
jgi:hypothetical protein